MPGVAEGDIGEWYRTVRVDLAACREYAKAVYAQSADFIANADDATLARPIDLSGFGMGSMPLAVVFEIFVVGHLNNLSGEISAIRGVEALRGYPLKEGGRGAGGRWPGGQRHPASRTLLQTTLRAGSAGDEHGAPAGERRHHRRRHCRQQHGLPSRPP